MREGNVCHSVPGGVHMPGPRYLLGVGILRRACTGGGVGIPGQGQVY